MATSDYNQLWTTAVNATSGIVYANSTSDTYTFKFSDYERPKTKPESNLAWLDRRVNEMRVAL